MPSIFEQTDLPAVEKNGANVTTLANQTILGADALYVQRMTFDAGVKSEPYKSENVERFVYVIRGKGQARVGGQAFPLEAESVLWLEKDDTFYFESGVDGLEVLLCHAPAGE